MPLANIATGQNRGNQQYNNNGNNRGRGCSCSGGRGRGRDNYQIQGNSPSNNNLSRCLKNYNRIGTK
uniref:Uncharacterized protein n=1 Tax=Nelumbo nucifera TaxID=4432 RepID=A0A822ZD04_NELNU|nr:TPA_asm: hypothetical protein HUJ06_013761 [Nelumbo nucifera]DAD39440.1 TPA_asm: hypothetical protein HUJ06_013763 [Nelumbo nucifera]